MKRLTAGAPEFTTEEAFRDWTVQKLAGLQVLVESINGQLLARFGDRPE